MILFNEGKDKMIREEWERLIRFPLKDFKPNIKTDDMQNDLELRIKYNFKSDTVIKDIHKNLEVFEFIGDFVLDYAVMEYIYNKDKSHTPETLSSNIIPCRIDTKHIITCNDTLGYIFVCTKLNEFFNIDTQLYV